MELVLNGFLHRLSFRHVEEQPFDRQEVPPGAVDHLPPVLEPPVTAVDVFHPVLDPEGFLLPSHRVGKRGLHQFQVVRVDNAPPVHAAPRELAGGVAREVFHLGTDEADGPVGRSPVDDSGDVVHQGKELARQFRPLFERFRHGDAATELLDDEQVQQGGAQHGQQQDVQEEVRGPVGDAHQDDCRMGEDLDDTDDHHGSCDDGDGSRPPAHTRLFPLTRRRPFSFPPNVLFYCR
ncbi:MAG: hypothetical protein A2Z26_00390 [Deltaproteobacteria bacterium RBG_16_66_15]|nr:MAG: hypothetical protein A2Z26_00390 [Deltaproteobacteria bacterium RBG_16_66_15]